MMRCRNCEQLRGEYARGLCRVCHLDLLVRAAFPAVCGYRYYPSPDFMGMGKAPDEPTDCLPGTNGKVAVLEQRASAGQRLWHPLDASVEQDWD